MSGEPVVVVSPYGREYGPPRTLEHVARGLLLGGYKPVCVVPKGAYLTPTLRDLNPRIEWIDGLTTFPRTFDPVRLSRFMAAHVSAAEQIAALVKETGARAVYSSSEAIFCGGLAARRAGVSSLAHVIGMSIASPRWGAAVYIRMLNAVTDSFIACSSAVAQMLTTFGVPDDRITVVHNGIEIAEIDQALAEPARLDDAGPRIGMVAAYDSRKGHELFVEAAALVTERFPEARFYLIGSVLEGQDESAAFERRVDALIGSLGLDDCFVRPGFVAAPEVYRWIQAMDVVVVPSKTEAFAHALLEGMACRRPVVATAIEGNLDAFVDRHSGIYVGRRPASLADAICRLLADPTEAAAIGSAARRRVELLFDVRVTLPCIGEAVRDLLRLESAPSHDRRAG